MKKQTKNSCKGGPTEKKIVQYKEGVKKKILQSKLYCRPLGGRSSVPKLKWDFRKFKVGLKGKKKVTEHHQKVECPRKGTPGWWKTVWYASTNFLTYIFLLLLWEKLFISKYAQKHHKIYKTTHKTWICGMSMQRDSWLLKTWTKYLKP